MSGLISSLQNSSAALRVHSKGLETVGKNLANINNPAYAKQRVVIGDRGQINTGIATEMMGVEAMELRQNRDSMLDKGVMRELNATSALEAAKHVLQSAETALGQFLDRTEDGTSIQNVTGPTGGGISEALTDFFNAWESFSVKPNDVAEKQLLIAKAQILADKFNGTDKRLNQVQLDVDQQIETDIIVVNDLLNEIAEINDYIAKAENVKPFSAVDLRDQRQAKLEQLSKYVDVTFVAMDPDFKKSLGRVDVILNNGADPAVKLLSGSQVAASGQFEYDAENRQLTWSGAPATPIPSGSLAARLDAATNIVAETRQSIYDLADHLQEEVNTAYQAAGGTGNVLNLATTSAGLINLSYNTELELSAGPLDANGVPTGGNQVALKVAELGTKVYESSGIAEFVSTDPHGFDDGDKVYYSTQNGLMWVKKDLASNPGFDLAKVGVTDSNAFYVVDKVSDVSFRLKTNDTGEYLNKTQATSPITKVTNFEESYNQPLSPNITPYIKEFNLPDFKVGDQVRFTDLPVDVDGNRVDEYLDSKLVYTVRDSGNRNGLYILESTDSNGDVQTLLITKEDLFGENGAFNPKIELVSNSAPTAQSVTPTNVTYEFVDEFVIADPSFADGDLIEFSGVPLDTTGDSFLTRNEFKLVKNDTGNFSVVYASDDYPASPVLSDLFGTNTEFTITKKSGGASTQIDKNNIITRNDFYGDFDLTLPGTFNSGDAIKLKSPGEPFSENETYTLHEVKVDPITGIEDPNGAKTVYQVRDINGVTISNITEDSLSNAQIEFVAKPQTPLVQTLQDGDVTNDLSNGRFLGVFTGPPTEIIEGRSISFENLPSGSLLNPGDLYTITTIDPETIDAANPDGTPYPLDAAGNQPYRILDANGDSIADMSTADFQATTNIVFPTIIDGETVTFDVLKEFEGSFAGNFNSIVTVLAQELNTTNIRLEDQELSEKMAVESRDQYSGVSQDEEVTDMMKFQRSFQASARHINIIDTLLDQVVNRLGIG